MGKKQRRKTKGYSSKSKYSGIKSISRDGGQIALRGIHINFCIRVILILSSSNSSNFFQLEGLKNIDCIIRREKW